jgi:NAD(P) transhydrogenase subunit alpha
MPTIGVPAEDAPRERRVALVPDVARRMVARGLDVRVERGAGARALIPDAAFADAGARLVADVSDCDVVLCVTPPDLELVARLRPGATVIGFLSPATATATLDALQQRGVTAFALESIPRISRAQAMDALSSQATLAGYKAALLAAEHSTRLLPMMTTAAGTIPPARALVLGAGVAGLQALSTARRIGARVTGYDVRPETEEQVRSVGADWLDLGIEAAGAGGYARELTDSERDAQQRALTEAISGFDIVITTALVPGRPAPRLVSAAAVAGMRAGSVVVDLAGEAGGNCELSAPGEVVVRHDVTITAPLNLPASVPEHASQLLARNLQALLELMLVDVDDGVELRPDMSDEILAGACVAGATPVAAAGAAA